MPNGQACPEPRRRAPPGNPKPFDTAQGERSRVEGPVLSRVEGPYPNPSTRLRTNGNGAPRRRRPSAQIALTLSGQTYIIQMSSLCCDSIDRQSSIRADGLLRWIKSGLEWWDRYWLRIQMAATPIGSLLVTLWLSQIDNVGWWWNSQEEFEVAATFASAGILFYTASFATLETGLWFIMVLALQALKKYEEDRAKRRQKLRNDGSVMWQEAERLNKETGEPVEEIFKRLNNENWQPAQS